jgi:hypothetical protein
MTILPKYNEFDGLHNETGSIRNALAYQSVKAPHTGRPVSEALLLGSRSGPSELVSNRIRTSNTHCATSGRQARVLGFRREVVRAATGTLGDQPPYVHLQEPPRVQP